MLFIIEYKVREPYFFLKRATWKKDEGKVGRAICVAYDKDRCLAKIAQLEREYEFDFFVHTGFSIISISDGKDYAKSFIEFMRNELPLIEEVMKKVNHKYSEEIVKEVIV